MENNISRETSYYDGKVSEFFGWSILGGLLTAISGGLAYPWAFCMTHGYNTNHTVVEGKRLNFSGNGLDLFLNSVKWIFLCIITLGIYGFWMTIELEKWKTKNTSFLIS